MKDRRGRGRVVWQTEGPSREPEDRRANRGIGGGWVKALEGSRKGHRGSRRIWRDRGGRAGLCLGALSDKPAHFEMGCATRGPPRVIAGAVQDAKRNWKCKRHSRQNGIISKRKLQIRSGPTRIPGKIGASSTADGHAPISNWLLHFETGFAFRKGFAFRGGLRIPERVCIPARILHS